jgi:hypothetical protein
MLPILLSVSLLAGVGTSAGVGETSPSAILAADIQRGEFRAEIAADSARKWFVPGPGYLLHGGVDWSPAGGVFVGVGQSYRHTSLWSKRITWMRAGIVAGPLTLLGEIAPGSVDGEMKLEARVRHCNRRICAEVRGWVLDHDQRDPGDTYGYGTVALIGVRFGR